MTEPTKQQPMVYYDNTRLSDYKECPRKFFFRHIKHWRRKGIAMPLIFGLSWHEAMDVVWGLMGRTDDTKVHALAFERFCQEWVAQGQPMEEDANSEEIERWKMRRPSVASEMLWHYIQKVGPFIRESEIINIERPFAVPLDPENPNLFYIGRLDKEIRRGRSVHIVEHKTTTAFSKEHGFLLDYQQSWTPNSQIDGYLHSGHMLHGDDMKSVYVDAVLVHKVHHSIQKFIPVERMLTALDDWRNATQMWVDRVENDKAVYRSGDTESCFPMNTNSCHGKYGQCSYIDVCKFVAKPMQRTTPPEGFEVERWSPFETLGMQKIGLPPEDLEDA